MFDIIVVINLKAYDCMTLSDDVGSWLTGPFVGYLGYETLPSPRTAIVNRYDNVHFKNLL